MRTLRRVGFGLLIAAVVVDLLSVAIAPLRGFVRKQWSRAVDDVVPQEHRLLDLALDVLRSTDAFG
jgi:hypothetical protein